VDANWLQNYPSLKAKVYEMLTNFFLDHGGDIEAAIKHHQEPSKKNDSP
jgi:hypothetical protein